MNLISWLIAVAITVGVIFLIIFLAGILTTLKNKNLKDKQEN